MIAYPKWREKIGDQQVEHERMNRLVDQWKEEERKNEKYIWPIGTAHNERANVVNLWSIVVTIAFLLV